MSARSREVLVEELLGRVVHDCEGERIGRLEEIVAERKDDALHVIEFEVGELALFQRLSALSVLRGLTRWLAPGSHRGWRVPWDRLDLSDPLHPRTTVPKAELARLRRSR